MDYTKAPRLFQLQKVARYVRMYGPGRTMVKVLGQLHMKRTYGELPRTSDALAESQIVGLIGCGNYAYTNIAHYLREAFGDVIGACMDVDANHAASLAARYRVPLHTTDAAAVIRHPRVRLVFIASNHASHAEYAIDALNAGRSVYIEKPHVVTEDQLDRLTRAAEAAPGRLFLGFNRPGSPFGQRILQALSGENGAGMYNWFVAGHAIDPEHWYFAPQEGGRILGNLCHWTDFVLRLAGDHVFPVEIRPTRASQSDCDIAVTYTFPDATIAVITFSAKGHTFEGVTESFHGHRGDVLIAMHDYKTLTIDRGAQKIESTQLFRDHGHERNIASAFRNVVDDAPYDRERALRHMRDTAWLFLNTKRALEENRPLVVQEYRPATVRPADRASAT